MRLMSLSFRLVLLVLVAGFGGSWWLSLQANDQTTAAVGDKKPSEKPAEKSLADELPRIPAIPFDKTMASFELQQGFKLELVAHEPDVIDPVDACFDENGRMFVAEMRDYPFSPEPRPMCPEGRGRKEAAVVRMLEDTDADGIYDRSTVFADKLEWVTSVACYKGGIFATAAPYIYYFKDTDGDGVADVREIVFSGFSRHNVQALINNLKWGLDNHLYCAGGMNGGTLKRRGQDLFPLAGAQILRIDPVKETLEPLSGGSQFGYSTDDWGNQFVSSNSDHIQEVIFPHHYLLRNPFLPVPGVTRSIAVEGGSGPVFRKSTPEPWRLVRTKRRAADPELSKRLPQSELVPTGFFTSATGVTIYRGSAYPEEYRGNAFIGDVGGNLIHRKQLTPKGAGFSARRSDLTAEFLTSTDNWFRPANFVNAPDGTLYVMDVYRETIEHPASIPDDIKAFLHLESGNDKGRIYRLVAPGMKRITPPKLGAKSAVELVAELESPNSWNRETAQRLLWERQDQSAVEALKKVALSSQLPQGRLHALYTLSGLNALTPDLVLTALSDPHPGVREHAVKLSDSFVNQSEKLVEKLLSMTGDDTYRVRWQLAFTLGEIKSPAGAEGLARLARKDIADPDMRTAWLSSIVGQAGPLFVRLLADQEFRAQPAAQLLLAQIAGVAGAIKEGHHAEQVLSGLTLSQNLNLTTRQALLQALGDGLARNGKTIAGLVQSNEISAETKAAVTGMFESAAKTLSNKDAPLPERAAAIGLLAFADVKLAQPVLTDLLLPQTPPPLQIAGIKALSQLGPEGIEQLLVTPWRGYTPTVRREVVDLLLRSVPRMEFLMSSVSEGKIKPSEVERDKKQLLLNHPNETVRNAAKKVFGGDVNSNRGKVIADYQKGMMSLQGDAARGKLIFQKNCAVCHQVGDIGKAVGPNLASTQSKTPGDLLVNILDPNREALPAFISYTVVTDQGINLTGIIASESATSITLRRADGAQDVVLRANIDEMVSSGVSLMPEGLEKEILPPQMADLIEFVRSIPPATNPPAAK
ncbi:MAG: putative rane-bound dehydrogenase domain protein [Planctomycetaceae bacterium]|nr:putative rane-bound dehydrogenase domain protein [Planctomycetaceae bacterium]